MRDLTDFKDFLLVNGLDHKLVHLLEVYKTVLPKGQDVFRDKWDVIDWVPRPGNLKVWLINFDVIKNPGLKLMVKIYVLSKRFAKKIYGATATGYICAIYYLDVEMKEKTVSKLSTEDFYATEKSLAIKFESGAVTYLRILQAFANWMRININPFLEYSIPKSSRIAYGRGGTDKGRAAKCLPDEVVSQLFGIANAPDLDEKNKFYLNAFVLDTVMQGRINELATLPRDCLIKPSGALAIKVFSEKGGVLGIRHFPQVLAPAVTEAVSYIQSVTENGRSLIRTLKKTPQLDWQAIVADDAALRYFTGKFVAAWTREHKLLNGDAVWCNSLGCAVDAIGALQHHKGSYRLASKSLNVSDHHMRVLVRKQEGARIGQHLLNGSGVLYAVDFNEKSWKSSVRKNPLAISIAKMEKSLELMLWPYADRIFDIMDAGLRCQVNGEVYPDPIYNSLMEKSFVSKVLPVVIGRNGTILLEAENALFVVPRNLLNSNKTRSNQYQLISDSIFTFWLCDQKENDDSIFKKYDIRDPRTGEIADFSWHDIRHWLQSVLKRGGLTDTQASLLAGRKDSAQMKVYDHTPASVRSDQLSRMRLDIKGGQIKGNTAETYSQLRIENSELAEEYLIASTLVVNSMPHGSCTLNLALTPCIHNLSCFSANEDGGLCNHLQVDAGDVKQIQEVERLHGQSLALMHTVKDMGGESSPQYDHYSRVANSTKQLLEATGGVVQQNGACDKADKN
jgi:hypothetical protein